jgi:hypothetical protein
MSFLGENRNSKEKGQVLEAEIGHQKIEILCD